MTSMEKAPRQAPPDGRARPARARDDRTLAAGTTSGGRVSSGLDTAYALRLQRTAGNRATSLTVQRSRHALALQRDIVTLASGGRISDTDYPGANLRENVLTAMTRLQYLGDLSAADLAREHAKVSALPAGMMVAVAQIPATATALKQAGRAILGAPAAETLLHVAIGAGVGWGMANRHDDVAAVQAFLHAQGLLSDSAYGSPGAPAEKAIVDAAGPIVQPATILQTMAALAAVKGLLLAGNPLPSPLSKGLTGPLAAQEAADIAAFEATKARHQANRTLLRAWIDEGFTQTKSRTLRNTCEWIKSGRTPFFILTKTHDSAARANASGMTGGSAWFSYPTGDLYGSVATYQRRLPTQQYDNTNVHLQDPGGAGGFQEDDGITIMESVIPSGKEKVWSGLKHELQHRADLADQDDDLERYKSEFRAYWMGSREPDRFSTTKIVSYLGYRWTERQYAIFWALYHDSNYAYVKQKWDAEAARSPAERKFRAGVLEFTWPTSLNPTNSMRVDLFNQAVLETTFADCDAANAGTPNAHVNAVKAAAAALNRDDRHDIKGGPETRDLLREHLRGKILRDVKTLIA